MPSKGLYNRMKAELDAIQVVDTHEHMYLPEEDYLELGGDFAQFLFQYNIDDLMSAGMEMEDMDGFFQSFGRDLAVDGKLVPVGDKWRYIKPHWENARFTGYGRAVRHSLSQLFGVDDFTDTSHRTVTDQLRALLKPGIYRKILKNVCGFHTSINDIDTMVQPGAFERMDRDLFHFAARFRHFSYAYYPGVIEALEAMFGRTIRTMAHLEDVLDDQFDRWMEEGRVAIKMGDAYLRDIHYEDSPREDAERVLRRVFTYQKHSTYAETQSFAEARPFENYIVHRVLDRAGEYNLPVIIHTGIQAFVRDELANSRALLVTNLLRKYPNVHFHLLHASYPWMGEAACLAKQFPNVTLDLTWTQVIVPEGAREGLGHMLDMVPVNKIHCFGGDYMSPLNIWGALEVARENAAHVLAEKVETGHMDETQAVSVAEKIFNRNARDIFGV